MANKFEQFSSTNNEYEQENTFPNTVKENVKEETNIDMNWEKKIKTSFSIKKSNLEKLVFIFFSQFISMLVSSLTFSFTVFGNVFSCSYSLLVLENCSNLLAISTPFLCL